MTLIFQLYNRNKHRHNLLIHLNFQRKVYLKFLSGTISLIFGGPNLIKNFKDVGLFTWNEYFGYEGDEF